MTVLTPPGEEPFTRRPIGSWFGHRRCASVWLTTITSGAPVRSVSLKPRPLTIGSPIASKNRGETKRAMLWRMLRQLGASPSGTSPFENVPTPGTVDDTAAD